MIAPFPWARSICPRAVCSARSRSVVTGSLLSSRGAERACPFTSTTGSTCRWYDLLVCSSKLYSKGGRRDWRCGCDAVGRRFGRRVRAHPVGRTFVLYSLREDVASPNWTSINGCRSRMGTSSAKLRDHLAAEAERGLDRVRPVAARARGPGRAGPPEPQPASATATNMRPGGLVFARRSGPATPVMPTPRSASKRSARPRHRFGDLGAHRPVGGEQVPADAELLGLDVVRVGDHPAAHIAEDPGDRGERGRRAARRCRTPRPAIVSPGWRAPPQRRASGNARRASGACRQSSVARLRRGRLQLCELPQATRSAPPPRHR